MKYTLATILLLSIAPVFAQNPAPAPQAVEITPKKPVDLTVPNMALLQEENLQLRAQAINAQAQQAMAPLQQSFIETEKVLADWIASIKKDNGWGDDVIFNRTTKKFERAPAPAKK